LIVVDQFEELFRLRQQDDTVTEEAAHFVRSLLAGAEEREPEFRIFIVLTLRADYLGECAVFRPLPPAINRSPYLLPRMTTSQLRESIEGPASLAGVEITTALLERLLADVGDDPDQLPILQHLLMRMWEVREKTGAGGGLGREHYDDAGGWDEALNRHAEEVWANLNDRVDLATRMFQRLTDRAQGGREVRRSATVRELAGVAAVSPAAVIGVVEQYRTEGCNFLTSDSDELTEQSVVDISHESLIRRWKQLQGWMREEAEWAAWYRRVEDRRRVGGAHFVDPELELALQAKERGHWNEVWAQRYASPGITYDEVARFLEDSKRARDGGLDVYFARMFFRVIPATEQKHLFNLYLGKTKGYEGRGSLQAELRHLASSGLIARKPYRTIGELGRGTTFNLADHVELTDLGRFLIKSTEEERRIALAERYLSPINLHEADGIAAEIREMFEAAEVPQVSWFERYLMHPQAAGRVVGYLAGQVAARRGCNIADWAHVLLRCLHREQDEAVEHRETRPMWQLLVCIEAALNSRTLPEEGYCSTLRGGLGRTLEFLRADPSLDPQGQCKWKIEELLS
jgi:hypothetical protein